MTDLSLETSLNSGSVLTILVDPAVPVVVEVDVVAEMGAAELGRGGATWARRPARRTNWPAEEAKLDQREGHMRIERCQHLACQMLAAGMESQQGRLERREG